MYKQDLELNNQEGLICHEPNQPNIKLIAKYIYL